MKQNDHNSIPISKSCTEIYETVSLCNYFHVGTLNMHIEGMVPYCHVKKCGIFF